MIALAASSVVWLGYDDGGYSLATRSTFAVAVLWVLVVGSIFGLLPLTRPTRAAMVSAGLLAGFAVWTAASASWASNAEGAFEEFDRVALYLGVFVLAAFVAVPRVASFVADGLAIGITAIGFLGLASRLFPHLVSQRDAQALLPTAYSRLSYPINYWNGLGILLALAYPLLLRRASGGTALWRGLSLAPLPALSAAVYLTSSRTAAIAVAVGVVVLICFARDRWATIGAALAAGAGSALTILVLADRPAIVNVPESGTAPVGAGRTAALLIALICAGAGVAYGLGVRYLPAFRPRTAVNRALVALIVVGLAVSIVASHPVRRFDSFSQHLTGEEVNEDIRSHLLSVNGSGRWQYWQSAVDEFSNHRLKGGGAGSYEAWWAQHGRLAGYVRNAHSLYLEVLGELGVVGLLLLVGGLLVALGAGIRCALRSPPEEQNLRPALVATSSAFLIAAGVDWMWQVTVVSVVGIACLGLLAGMRSEGDGESRARLTGRARIVAVAAATVVGLALIAGQGIALLATLNLKQSQAAVRRGDVHAALRAALSARDLQPWAAEPYTQLALVEEQASALPEAERRIKQAITRNRADWRLWLIAARIQTKRGEIEEARRSLARARTLNPRDPSFP